MLLTTPKKKVASIIIGSMKPDKYDTGDFVQKIGEPSYKGAHEAQEDSTGTDSSAGLLTSSEAVLAAFKRSDAKGLASALKTFFELCDEMPHEEGEHLSESEEV